MGLKSDWMLLGGLTLWTGTVLDSFHILGWTPCLIAAFAMDVKGSVRMWEIFTHQHYGGICILLNDMSKYHTTYIHK